MAVADMGGGLERRLAWLLVFRGVVATALLLLTLAADIADWQVHLMAAALYGAVVGSYLTVFILGLLLRAEISPLIISAVHLTTSVLAAAMVVQGTGGVESGFSFLYLLVVLDGAIIGGRPVALTVAAVAALGYGSQLVLQLYGIFDAGLLSPPPPEAFVGAATTHLAAFFLVALLAGQLAQMLESALVAASAAQVDLRRATAFQAAVLEALPVGVLSVGDDGRVESANAAAARILGTAADRLLGTELPAVLLSEPVDATADLRTEIGGRPVVLGVHRSTVRYPLGGGRATAKTLVILVLEDRSETDALQTRLRARERLASIGQMAAAIAHELRNPLAAISGSVELLGCETTSGETRQRLRTIVGREIDRLNRLVEHFLLYARPTPPSRTLTDVGQLARDLVEVMAQDPGCQEHRLSVVAPAAVFAAVDAGQVRQLLWNLVRNAVEASAAGTPVVITVAGVGGESPGVSIAVRDHGAGLDPAIRPRLFEPFATTKSSGTGLGLAVVQRIADAHGGTVGLDDAPGGGTLAEVVLPSHVS